MTGGCVDAGSIFTVCDLHVKIPLMNRNEAMRRLRSLAPRVKAMGATGLYVFGSVAKDAAIKESDIDIFIDYDPASSFSLLELAGIQQAVEETVGLRADVTTRDALHPLLRAEIEQSAIRVF
jgi:predicted nucleotidyltransferase